MRSRLRTRSSEQTSYERGASKNKYVVYSQVNRMPLFALEQIVLLSFAERERAGRLRVCARKTETRARYEDETRDDEKSITESNVSVPLCFFRSVLPLLTTLETSNYTLILIPITGTMVRTHTRKDVTNS